MSCNLADLVETEIVKPWYRRHSRELRRLHDSRRESVRRAHAGLSIGLLSIFYSTCIGLDLALIPDVWKLSLFNRFIVTPIIGWTAFAYSRKGPGKIVEIRNAFTIINAACLCSVQITATKSHTGVLAYLTLAPMFVIAANIFCNLPLLVAALTSLVICLMMSWIMLLNIDAGYNFIICGICNICWIAVLTLFINWRSGREQTRVFLHQLKLELQQKTIEASNADLIRLSSTDALTGLKNRRSADAALTAFWRTWTVDQTSFAVILLDVDFFKRYNDKYGHLAGDQCLIAVAKAMQDVVTAYDGFVARFGGEEFIVLTQAKSEADVLAMAGAIRNAIRALSLDHHHRADGTTIVTISMGIAFSDVSDVTKPENLVKRADEALYRAKEAGRDRLFIFEPLAAEAQPTASRSETARSDIAPAQAEREHGTTTVHKDRRSRRALHKTQ